MEGKIAKIPYMGVCVSGLRNKKKGRAREGFIIGKKIEGNINKCRMIAKKEKG